MASISNTVGINKHFASDRREELLRILLKNSPKQSVSSVRRICGETLPQCIDFTENPVRLSESAGTLQRMTEMRFSPLSLFSKIRVQRTNGSGMILSLRRTISQRQLSPRGQEEEALTANSTFEAAKQLNAKQSGGISSTAASGNKTASDGSFNAVIVQQKRIDRYRTAAAMCRNVQLCAKSFFTAKSSSIPAAFFSSGLGLCFICV